MQWEFLDTQDLRESSVANKGHVYRVSLREGSRSVFNPRRWVLQFQTGNLFPCVKSSSPYISFLCL